MKCKEGRSESIERYRVLALFTKFYNKWFVAEEDKVEWSPLCKAKKVRILALVVSAPGKFLQEVKSERMENGNLVQFVL